MSSIKKKCISFIALLMAFVMTVTFSSTTANAADAVTQRMGPYQLSTGISRVNYYITDSVLNHHIGSTLVTLIDRAANSWVDTGYGYNPLYMYRTYNLYSSHIDIYASRQIIESFNRVNTAYWRGNSSNKVATSPTTSNWDYMDLTIYVDMHDWNDHNKLQRSIAHGMGHAFGLDDNVGNSESVMCDFYHVCNVYRPGKADHDGLNAMYN